MDQLPRLGKRELICLLLFTCNYVVSVWRGFLFLWVLGMGYVILLWHSLSLPYNYFTILKWGVRGCTLHGHVFMMQEKNHHFEVVVFQYFMYYFIPLFIFCMFMYFK